MCVRARACVPSVAVFESLCVFVLLGGELTIVSVVEFSRNWFIRIAETIT